MSYNVALFIDLENFFLARKDLSRRYDRRAFRLDLEHLTTFVIQGLDTPRLIVQRAYANFKAFRKNDQDDRLDYYLKDTPDQLMYCGIEPVQVFSFPKGTNKNAVDMRIAMDATSLVSTRSPVQQFILVTGDSDFIPLILELKRHGPKVTVIGVTGSTSDLFERYCDSFEYFEDLLAAEELPGGPSNLEPIRKILADLIEQHKRIKFAAIKPMLERHLKHPFDPNVFDCSNTGDFLRAYADDLSIFVEKGDDDWEIRSLPSQEVKQPTIVPTAVSTSQAPTEDASTRTQEMALFYQALLKETMPRVHTVRKSDWHKITELIYQHLARSPNDHPPTFYYRKLLDQLVEEAKGHGLSIPELKVSDVMQQL